MRLTILAFALAAMPAWAADSYTIDSDTSLPTFEVSHLGFTTQHGRFDKVSGTIVLDLPRHSGSVEFTIQTDSLDMGSKAWTAHLASEGLFNVAKYPTMVFRSDRLNFQGDAVVGADGTLTIVGVTRPVHLTVQHFRCGAHPVSHRALCGGDVNTTLKRSEFGLGKYLPAVGDEVTVAAPVVAYKD
jgi:polyisoprenoid-binding protein YceI